MRKLIVILICISISLFASHSSGNKDATQKEWEGSQSKVVLEKQLDYIVLASKKPIYHLRLDILQDAIRPLLEANEIKALTINDNFSQTPFLTAYKNENEILNIRLNEKEENLDLHHLFLLEKKIIYEDVHIANVKLYVHKNRIKLKNSKNKSIVLSENEKSYLQKKGSLSVCAIPNYLPYEKIDDDGKHLGILSDMVRIVEKQTNTNIKLFITTSWKESLQSLEKRSCDFIAGILDTKERRTFANFTKPYINEPLVIATSNEQVFINKATELNTKKVGIIKNYAFYDTLKRKYPLIHFVPLDTPSQALKKVSEGELFAFVDTLTSVIYHIKEESFIDLKISGKLDEFIEITMGSRNDEKELNRILQKVVNTINEEEKKTIFKKWADIEVKQTVDFKYLKEIVIAFILIILFSQFWMRKLSNANNKLYKAKKDLEESNKKLKLLASTDSLTKLYNRGYFTKISEKILSLAQREKSELSLIIMDIDKFKDINDTYGHQIGDLVIISLANTLKNSFRQSDVICRFGGEEFIVLLPKTSLKNAIKIAEKIRAKVEAIEVSFEKENKLKYTISLGIADVNVQKERQLEDSIKRADEALYEAKNNGRNQVCASL